MSMATSLCSVESALDFQSWTFSIYGVSTIFLECAKCWGHAEEWDTALGKEADSNGKCSQGTGNVSTSSSPSPSVT